MHMYIFFPQNVYNPYMDQQYLQMYGVPGTVNSLYPVGQFAQPLQSGHNYPIFRGYALPSHQIVQQSGPNVNNQTATPPLTIQAPYPAGNLPFIYQGSNIFLCVDTFCNKRFY